jgi:AtzE family amidohydrolase
MSRDLAELSALQIATGVKARRFTASAVAEALLARIERLNPTINAYTHVAAERAAREAHLVDRAIAEGRDPGPLAGVPYSVKNLFDLEGVVTVAGSKINRDNPPAGRDATAVARLGAGGAVCLGATNMGEYAYDFVTINAHDGPTRNPRDRSRSAGGSSGGSGAGVAAGLCALSLGTDTNGSVRVPASFCGVWGLKPTYGRLSRAGVFPFAGSLDTVGVLGRSVADLARAMDAISGPDERDPVCSSASFAPAEPEIERGVRDLRMGVLGGYFETGASVEALAAVAAVAGALGAAGRLELPEPQLARAAAYVITAAEGGELHRERLSRRARDYDPGARDRFIAGALTPAAWYLHAQRFRAWWKAQMSDVFARFDLLIAPATPITAPGLDQQTFAFGEQEIPVRANVGLFTQPITLIGLPVVAAPVHAPGGLPIGVQLVGRPNSEAVLLRAARVLEQAGVCAAPVAG